MKVSGLCYGCLGCDVVDDALGFVCWLGIVGCMVWYGVEDVHIEGMELDVQGRGLMVKIGKRRHDGKFFFLYGILLPHPPSRIL